MESKHVPLLSCSSRICSLRVPSWRWRLTRVCAVGTQRGQRRHRNPGPFQGLGPGQGWLGSWCWSWRNGQKGGEASEKEFWDGDEAVLRGAAHQRWLARKKHFSPRQALLERCKRQEAFVCLGRHSLPFDAILPMWWLCKPGPSTLIAERAGEESPGKKTDIRQSSFHLSGKSKDCSLKQ